jgi:UDP-N-acetylmuramyl pentapeptide phosphotransferase/UDP-N-acetylglucosamine-1-phosphate transferase
MQENIQPQIIISPLSENGLNYECLQNLRKQQIPNTLGLIIFFSIIAFFFLRKILHKKVKPVIVIIGVTLFIFILYIVIYFILGINIFPGPIFGTCR